MELSEMGEARPKAWPGLYELRYEIVSRSAFVRPCFPDLTKASNEEPFIRIRNHFLAERVEAAMRASIAPIPARRKASLYAGASEA